MKDLLPHLKTTDKYKIDIFVPSPGWPIADFNIEISLKFLILHYRN